MFNNLSSPAAYLSSRRSARPRDMVSPGPDDAQLEEILRLAMRTPDHGKLAPWRFVKVSQDARWAFATLLERAFVAANPDARPVQIEAAVALADMAPSLVIMIHSPQQSAKIPQWEQQLSSGAAGMNLLHAAHVHGFVGGWITGWAAFDETVQAALCQPQERVTGFFYFGSPGAELKERPRPDFAAKLSEFPASTDPAAI
ncbi:MAG: nitroreductase [Sphingorhabdus sp.]